jgi:hypothetical protein
MMTKRAMHLKAVTMFRTANPDVAATATITWVKPLRKVTYPTGYVGMMGSFVAKAPGFRTRTMHVDCNVNGYDMRVF